MSEGSCRCGALRFAAQGAPLVTMACHCRGCQKMSAGAFSLSSLYPAGRFRVEQGEPVRGGVGSGPRHMFCGTCMSWLYTVPEGMDDYVNVRSPMFGDATEHRPYIETHVAEGLGWAATGAELSFETVPPDEDFPRLIADYAAWDGRVKQ